MATNYTVRTRDTDGSNTSRFTTLAAAVRRFTEMAGGTVNDHIAEAYYAVADRGERLPLIEELRSLRAVSMYGTVVTFEAVSEQAIEAAAAARTAALAAAARPAPFPVREPAAPELATADDDVPF